MAAMAPIRFWGFQGNDSLDGENGDDRVFALDGDDTLHGGGGSDLLSGGLGADALDGGEGLDTGHYSGARVDYNFTENPDGSFTIADLRAGSPDGIDTLIGLELLQFTDGTIALSQIVNETPTDTALSANTVAENGAPTDIALSATTVVENAANGTLVGRLGGSDPDALDTLTFTLLDDAGGRFAIANGSDLVVADGALLDFEQAASHAVRVRVADAGGLAYEETFTIAVQDVAGLTLTSKAATLTGTDEADGLTGRGRAHTLQGLGGDDTLTGGKRADTLDGGAGADPMIGGKGNDTYIVDNPGDIVRELVRKGVDTVQTTLSSYTLGDRVENLTFTGAGPFAGTGNGLANRITGGAAGDRLDGAGGNDQLFGGGGRDTFVFKEGYSKDRVLDFTATGATSDFIEIAGTEFGSFAELQAAGAVAQVGANVVVTLGADTLTINSVTLANVADDILFV
jgi:Ca2+-binding RTX toxin-like protein